MRYYIEQFDTFWSLTRDEMMTFVKERCENSCYNLEEFRMLRSRPKTVRVDRWDEDSREYYSYDAFLMSCLDHDEHAFGVERDRLAEFLDSKGIMQRDEALSKMGG